MRFCYFYLEGNNGQGSFTGAHSNPFTDAKVRTSQLVTVEFSGLPGHSASAVVGRG